MNHDTTARETMQPEIDALRGEVSDLCELLNSKQASINALVKALEEIRDNARSGLWTLPSSFAIFAEARLAALRSEGRGE